MRQPHHIAVASLLLPMLAGCAAPAPPPAELAQLRDCQATGEPARTLAPAESCRFAAHARADWTPLPVVTRSGQRYRLALPAGQTWTDLWTSSDPRVGDEGSWLMNRVKHKRRLPDQPWFVLGAAQRGCAAELRVPVGAALEFQIQPGCQWAVFANDVDGFYWNNHGQVWLSLERLALPGR